MSNHNLFIHGADGAAEPATSEQILAAARLVLSHRVRRGASLSSPQKVREYLSMRLGHLDYEVFGLILVDKPGEILTEEHVKKLSRLVAEKVTPFILHNLARPLVPPAGE